MESLCAAHASVAKHLTSEEVHVRSLVEKGSGWPKRNRTLPSAECGSDSTEMSGIGVFTLSRSYDKLHLKENKSSQDV